MKKKTNIGLEYCYLIFIGIFLFCCQGNVQEKQNCSKFANEIYKEGVSDTSLAREAFYYQKILLERFGETSVKGLHYEAYSMQFYSTLGYGKSVKFEKRNGGCSITIKCNPKGEWLSDCKEYQIGIDIEEWNKLESMIYEFDFWTEEDFKANKDVLDGCVFLLEGNRPEAVNCDKKTYKLVARGSPRYDKIGALCNYIFEYEEHLKFTYEQMNEIK